MTQATQLGPLELASITQSFPSPEDRNRSSFRKVVILAFLLFFIGVRGGAVG